MWINVPPPKAHKHGDGYDKKDDEVGVAARANLLNGFYRLSAAVAVVLLALLLGLHAVPPDHAAGQLGTFLDKVEPGELFEGADRFGELSGDPPIVPVMRGDDILGYAYLNSDFTSSIGYSGKPIHIVVGIDTQGVIRGFKLVDHKEPIVLIGIPEAKVIASMNALIDKDMGRVASGAPDRGG